MVFEVFLIRTLLKYIHGRSFRFVRLEYCIIWRMFFIRNMNYLDWASILQWITKYRVLDLMHPVDLFNNAIFQSFTFKVCAIWGYIHITFQLQMNVTKICFTRLHSIENIILSISLLKNNDIDYIFCPFRSSVLRQNGSLFRCIWFLHNSCDWGIGISMIT